MAGKQVQIQVVMTPEQKGRIVEAAKRRGLSQSAFLRTLGLKEATRLALEQRAVATPGGTHISVHGD